MGSYNEQFMIWVVSAWREVTARTNNAWLGKWKIFRLDFFMGLCYEQFMKWLVMQCDDMNTHSRLYWDWAKVFRLLFCRLGNCKKQDGNLAGFTRARGKTPIDMWVVIGRQGMKETGLFVQIFLALACLKYHKINNRLKDRNDHLYSRLLNSIG